MGAVTSSGGKSLKAKYREVLIGFEKYSFSEEQIRVNEGYFESALRDLEACQECDGSICRTTVNHRCARPYLHHEDIRRCGDECFGNERAYIALYRAGCATYKAPVFAVHLCPGAAERKRQILEAITAKPWYEGQFGG